MVTPKRQPRNPDQAIEIEWEEESEVQTFREADFTDRSPEVEAIHITPVEVETIHPADTDVVLDLHHGLLLANLSPTGGDVDSDDYLARVAGEEAVGGTTPTPDQSVVEDLAISAGIEIPDRAVLHTNDLLAQRDAHRWELSVESSEDYYDRQNSLD